MFEGLLLLYLACSFLAPSVHAADADDWQKRTIYQVVTDRFATTDGSSPSCDVANRTYCGGTWDGLINRLDYIEDMGFDAIWISPVVANAAGTTAYGEAYHGYWTADLNALNPHFGSSDDLKSLSAALHGRGMLLMVDVVVNHMVAPLLNSSKATQPTVNFSAIAPFSSSGDFHPQCFVIDYTNQTEVEQCWIGDAKLPLVDLDTENADIVNKLYDWIHSLVETYNIDGLRIDTVKHIRKDFWPGFVSAAEVFTMGEVLADDTSYAAPYTDILDAVLDYPSWFALNSSFSSPEGNLSVLALRVKEAQEHYKYGAVRTGAFVDNHDQPRFFSLTNDTSLLRNAMSWPYIHDGIPIVYYGQEQGFHGGADPHNREPLWSSNYTLDRAQRPLLDQLGRLNAARRAAISASAYRFLDTPMKFLSPPDEARSLAVLKPPMLALLTNSGNLTSVVFDLPDAGLGARTLLVDVLSCDTWTTGMSGELQVTALHGAPTVLLPAPVVAEEGKLCREALGQRDVKIGGSERRLRRGWALSTMMALTTLFSVFVGHIEHNPAAIL